MISGVYNRQSLDAPLGGTLTAFAPLMLPSVPRSTAACSLAPTVGNFGVSSHLSMAHDCRSSGVPKRGQAGGQGGRTLSLGPLNPGQSITLGRDSGIGYLQPRKNLLKCYCPCLLKPIPCVCVCTRVELFKYEIELLQRFCFPNYSHTPYPLGLLATSAGDHPGIPSCLPRWDPPGISELLVPGSPCSLLRAAWVLGKRQAALGDSEQPRS